MIGRSALRAVFVSFALATAACAGEFDDDEDVAHRASIFQGRVNETPQQVEALARELAMRQHAAKYTTTDSGEMGRLKRKEQELVLRYRIAALRLERGFSRSNGDKSELVKIEQAIHAEKRKLARMKKRHREEQLAEKKSDPMQMEELPSLSPKFEGRDVPEDRYSRPDDAPADAEPRERSGRF